jgi:hypothetical protein
MDFVKKLGLRVEIVKIVCRTFPADIKTRMAAFASASAF